MTVQLDWRGAFTSWEVEELHAAGFGHDPRPAQDWRHLVDRHSLGWVCARQNQELVGFANVAWDGAAHAFLLDVVVEPYWQRKGVGTGLVTLAVRKTRVAGCEWLHVDFEDRLLGFYLDTCGFRPTAAGLLRVAGE